MNFSPGSLPQLFFCCLKYCCVTPFLKSSRRDIFGARHFNFMASPVASHSCTVGTMVSGAEPWSFYSSGDWSKAKKIYVLNSSRKWAFIFCCKCTNLPRFVSPRTFITFIPVRGDTYRGICILFYRHEPRQSKCPCCKTGTLTTIEVFGKRGPPPQFLSQKQQAPVIIK